MAVTCAASVSAAAWKSAHDSLVHVQHQLVVGEVGRSDDRRSGSSARDPTARRACSTSWTARAHCCVGEAHDAVIFGRPFEIQRFRYNLRTGLRSAGTRRTAAPPAPPLVAPGGGLAPPVALQPANAATSAPSSIAATVSVRRERLAIMLEQWLRRRFPSPSVQEFRPPNHPSNLAGRRIRRDERTAHMRPLQRSGLARSFPSKKETATA